MHKTKGLSLIETLISLTIIGISLIALLPVLTVKQHTLSPVSGNENFTEIAENAAAATPKYYTTGIQRVNIGPLDANLANTNLTINARNFEYQNIPALYISERLYLNSNKILSINNGLSIASGNILPGIDIKYPMNIFLNDTNMLITNDDATSHEFAPTFHDTANNWTLSKQFINSASPRTFLEYTQILDNDTDSTYSISNQGDEYTHVSQHQFGGNTWYNIGIGRNATTLFSNPATRTAPFHINKNFIGIFNDTPATPLVPREEPFFITLALGRITTGNNAYSDPNSYVITHQQDSAGNASFKINANIQMNNATKLSANGIIVPSDKRLKTILSEYTKSTKEILKIKPVVYTYKDDEKQLLHVGTIAQSIKKIFPEAVRVNKSTGYLMVTNEPIFYAALNSIKDLNAKNKQLEKENDELEKKIAELRKIAGGKHE